MTGLDAILPLVCSSSPQTAGLWTVGTRRTLECCQVAHIAPWRCRKFIGQPLGRPWSLASLRTGPQKWLALKWGQAGGALQQQLRRHPKRGLSSSGPAGRDGGSQGMACCTHLSRTCRRAQARPQSGHTCRLGCQSDPHAAPDVCYLSITSTPRRTASCTLHEIGHSSSCLLRSVSWITLC